MPNDIWTALQPITTGTVFRQLQTQVRSRLGVVPFVGAGLSVPCGLPTWTGGLLSLAKEVRCEVTLEDQLSHGRFEEAAEMLETIFGADGFSSRLEQLFGIRAAPSGPVLRVPSLTNGPVITTNFDRVLEDVFGRASRPFAAVVSGADVTSAGSALHSDAEYLLKLHGDLTDRANRILTLREYRQHYETDSPDGQAKLPGLLEQIFTSRTLLFLGCSLSYDRTIQLLKRVKSQHAAPPQHYALLKWPNDKESGHRRQLHLEALHIQPVWYPAGRHELLGPLLDRLVLPDEDRDSLFSRTGSRAISTDIPHFPERVLVVQAARDR
jgi:hypothetical protein